MLIGLGEDMISIEFVFTRSKVKVTRVTFSLKFYISYASSSL